MSTGPGIPDCGSDGTQCLATNGPQGNLWPAPGIAKGVMATSEKMDQYVHFPQGTWGYLSGCNDTCRLSANPNSEVGTCGVSGLNCQQATGLDVPPCTRKICRLLEPGFSPGGPLRTLQKARNCCVNDYGTTSGFPQAVVGNGCGSMTCPGSQCCARWAKTICMARGKSLVVTDPANPDMTEAPWAIKGEAICQKLRDWDFDSYRNVMDALCMTDGKPNDYTRSAACLAYYNDPKLQENETSLMAYCRNAPVQQDEPVDPDHPAKYRRAKDDDLCGCFRSQDFYNQWNTAVNNQWNVPPGVLDARPMCSYPGCKSALVKDMTSTSSSDPCKETNVAVCMQEATVDNAGNIGGAISISQNCPPNSQITPRFNPKAKCALSSDCTMGQVCDTTRQVCTNPSDSMTQCMSDSVCVAGMTCGPVTGDGKRYCQSKAAEAGGSAPMPPWAIAVLVVAGVVFLAGLAWLLWRWRKASTAPA